MLSPVPTQARAAEVRASAATLRTSTTRTTETPGKRRICGRPICRHLLAAPDPPGGIRALRWRKGQARVWELWLARMGLRVRVAIGCTLRMPERREAINERSI